jgi:hypothetical protein
MELEGLLDLSGHPPPRTGSVPTEGDQIMRRYHKWLSVGLLFLTPGIAAAGLFGDATKSSASNSASTAAASDRAVKKKKEINQDLAVRVGKALQKVKLNGYDIQIDVLDGIVTLDGTVGSREQRMAVEKAASAVTGVKGVYNRLRIGEAAPQRGIVPQTSAAQGMPAAVIRGQNPTAPVAMPAYGPPDAMGGNAIYNQPNLPNNSWPTYAQYPNYSAVTYPSQYSASAWPYIGPFYPYPQVPMGWRRATLEWNEGNWNLSFSPKTNRWWWFMNPNCW